MNSTRNAQRLAYAGLSLVYPGIGQWAAGHRGRGIAWGVVTALLIVWVLLITCISMFRAALAAGDGSFFEILGNILSGLTFLNCYAHWLVFVLVYLGSVIDAALLTPRKE